MTKNDQRFVYDGYLQIADNNGNVYIWDPTEPIATRPFAWNRNGAVSHYTHDGNKNVSEVVEENGDIAAHYEYAPFGAETIQSGYSSADNLWRFSSEYAEDDTATVYYNYRHYAPIAGRWLSRDPIQEDGGVGLYIMSGEDLINSIDYIGLARMISGHRRPMPKGSCLWPHYKYARDIMRLMDKLNNLTDTKGNKCFDVELKDFMTVDIEAVLQDLKDNKDNVYIISHGALKVNGKFWKYWYYYWNNDNDKVEEGFCRDGRSDFIDFKQFEKPSAQKKP